MALEEDLSLAYDPDIAGKEDFFTLTLPGSLVLQENSKAILVQIQNHTQ